MRTPERYVALIDAGESAEGAGEELDGPARRMEGLQLQLRTRDGVPADALDAGELPGLVEEHGDRLVLTRAGRLLANEVARAAAVSLHADWLEPAWVGGGDVRARESVNVG